MAAKRLDALPARIRHRFPIFERQVYVNCCSQGALSDSRARAAYARYLDDWDEYGAPWEYWVERAEAVRAAFAGLVERGRGRDRGHDLASPPGVSALVSGLRFGDGRATDRRHRLRVPDDRPDLARAGAPRGASSCTCPRRTTARPARALRGSDRRGTALVAVTHVCYRNGAVGRRRRRRRASPTSAARPSGRRLPDGRLAPDRREGARRRLPRRRACSSTCSARPGSPSSTAAASSCERHRPTATGWFADREHLRDGHPRLLARADARGASSAGTPPVPASTRASPGSS